MREFTAKWTEMDRISDELKSCAADIEKCRAEMSGISTHLYIDSKSTTQIMSALKAQNKELKTLQNRCSLMNRALTTAAKKYRTTEKEIVSEKANLNSKSYIKKAVGGTGIIGGVINTIWQANDAKNELNIYKKTKAIGDTIKNGLQLITKVKDVVGENDIKVKWKKLVGFQNKATKATGKEAFFESIDKNLEEYVSDDGLKCTTKWLGTALSFLGNGLDNYYEEGLDIHEERFWQETIMETAVDWGKDMLIGAVITGACVCAIGTAPAVLVAGGTAVVSWGLDKISVELTGKKATEFISDSILDYGLPMLKKAGNAISSAGKSFANWLSGGMQLAGAAG